MRAVIGTVPFAAVNPDIYVASRSFLSTSCVSDTAFYAGKLRKIRSFVLIGDSLMSEKETERR